MVVTQKTEFWILSHIRLLLSWKYTTVLVKQEKGEKQSPIEEVNFYVESRGKEVNRESFTDYGSNFTFDALENATIVCTEQGNNLHVECTGKIDYSWSVEDATLTFDIQNYKDLSSSDLKIMNLKYHINKVEKSETSQVTRELSADKERRATHKGCTPERSYTRV